MQTVFSDEDERKRLFGLIGSVTKDGSGRDTEAMLDFLTEQPEVTPGVEGRHHRLLHGRRTVAQRRRPLR